jgi:hypothetical protein
MVVIVLIGIRLLVPLDIPVLGKAVVGPVAAEVDPGNSEGYSRSEKVRKYLCIGEEVFGIGDDYWVTFRKYFLDS